MRLLKPGGKIVIWLYQGYNRTSYRMSDMGAQMVKEVADKTSKVAGNGTTTATVYAEAIFGGDEERRQRRQPHANPARHQRGRRRDRRRASQDVQEDRIVQGIAQVRTPAPTRTKRSAR